ncbi:Putative prophage phiRv2 integrase [Mycobacterium simulans]|uniref:Prophage phiRv2 integrase n=1 Tax=Mycobacterium simulans TaxID=627089 RepID=A0A7Z7IR27_9MYCO|nr:site-specific integrase [Mycobacterium simulans]SOJ56985.1 Putative prophage phiRv2 integrase [Mycobacterium simulans]
MSAQAVNRERRSDSSSSTFAEYADAWLTQRALTSRTRDHYRRQLQYRLLPTFASTELRDISPAAVRDWYATTAAATVRNHAYSVLRLIMAAAVADNLIDTNPCQLPAVTTSHRVEKARPTTLDEIEAITAAMPEAYQTLVLMAGWFAMPFSELRELRRKDVDLAHKVVRVRRAVVLDDGAFEVTTPNSTEGIRDIAIPAHVLPTIKDHLRNHVQPGRESLLFPSVRDPNRYLPSSVLYRMFHLACRAAGRPDLRVPDLQRSAAALAASV